MNVPLNDKIGLAIYREAIYREGRCAAQWYENYGPDALQRTPDPMTMINLGKFSKVRRGTRTRRDRRSCSFPSLGVALSARACTPTDAHLRLACIDSAVCQCANAARCAA